jgi:hypothetical protein
VLGLDHVSKCGFSIFQDGSRPQLAMMNLESTEFRSPKAMTVDDATCVAEHGQQSLLFLAGRSQCFLGVSYGMQPCRCVSGSRDSIL